MPRIPALIIGAGQAGLAMSFCLDRHGIEHVVLERGRVAERWRGAAWKSLRLLTPNWASRLPGWRYQGPEPDSFMTAQAFADHLTGYAGSFNAPVRTGMSVRSVRAAPQGYIVDAGQESWHASSVVIATGHCDVPGIPRMAGRFPSGIRHVTPVSYRYPDDLPEGGVLVVGAAATGAQIADEIQRAGGRSVTLAAGNHTRLPRMYRGRDIWRWLDAIGILEDRWHEVKDIVRCRREASFQLIGRSDGATLNLAALHEAGVRIVGRALDVDGGKLRLQADLPATLNNTQAALERLLMRIDEMADAVGAPADPAGARPILLPPAPVEIDLMAEGIRTVVWATGYRRDYSWLHVPILDAEQEIIHDGGVTPAPGLYVLGLRFMRRRRSNFIDGVGHDAAELSSELAGYLAGKFHQAA